MRCLSTASTGMLAQQTNVDTISHNIANMNTTGYKRQRAEFQDLLYQNVSRPGASTGPDTKVPTGIQIGLGVKTAGVYRIHEQGTLQQTDNRYDLGIQGRGYFQVTMPSGETAYTRDGSFQVSDQGELVTTDGYQVQPGITLPQDAVDVSISKTGEVQVKTAGAPEMQTVGQLHQRGWARGPGWQSVPGDRLIRPGDGRLARRPWTGIASAGLRRRIKREPSGRDHGAHYGTARVRDEQSRREDG